MTEETYTLSEALAARKALREASGAAEETFDLADLIGMASDEIEMLMEQGKSADEIAAMIQSSTGKPVTGKDVEEHYIGPEERDSWDDDDEQEGGGKAN